MNHITSKPKISVIINFYNMEREAKRTLFSLTTDYQQGINSEEYEVIAIDNGSTKTLKECWVKSLGDNFKYFYFDAQSPSPCAGLNYAINQASSELIMCCIDGARILSPGILKYTLAAAKLHDSFFIYTLGMHIGHKPQNYLIKEGYNQQVEDKLLQTVDWRNNGYKLFHISSTALSCQKGYFAEISESNCFSIKKSDFINIGGFDERFTSAGGGLANPDIFNRIHEDKKITPILLLGEATFHQFHGGVATNVIMKKHPWAEMEAEYRNIRDKSYKHVYRVPEYYGTPSKKYHSSLMQYKDQNSNILIYIYFKARKILRSITNTLSLSK